MHTPSPNRERGLKILRLAADMLQKKKEPSPLLVPRALFLKKTLDNSQSFGKISFPDSKTIVLRSII